MLGVSCLMVCLTAILNEKLEKYRNGHAMSVRFDVSNIYNDLQVIDSSTLKLTQ